MDALKAEIAARKRKKSQQTVSEEQGEEKKKEVEEERPQKYQRQWDKNESKQSSEKPTKKDENKQITKDSDTNSTEKEEKFNISNEETIKRLRQKGHPIRLFGETDKERRFRLRELELIEERGEKMGQNDFMKALKGAESSVYSTNEGQSSKGKTATRDTSSSSNDDNGEGREGVGMNNVLDLSLIKRDISKVYPIIYYTLKGLVKDWETSLAERPIEIRQSQSGKMASATQVQTSDYLKPLFKQLRTRSVKPDVLARLAEIVHFVQKRQYRNANDSYLQLSIGNAPWPMGVTMVGIHERSGREKIFSSNVAHVLNDEVSRKYIQSLKRLMTFAQTRYPPSDVSMLMG